MTILASLIAAAALAASPPENLPVFEIFGISTQDHDHYPQSRAECLKWDEDRVFCPTGWQLGNVRTESLSFLYVRGKLAEVRGLARIGEFQLMTDTLAAKYGQPEHAQDGLVWHFRGGTLTAREIEPDFDNNLAGCEFRFVSEENSQLPARQPVVNF